MPQRKSTQERFNHSFGVFHVCVCEHKILFHLSINSHGISMGIISREKKNNGKINEITQSLKKNIDSLTIFFEKTDRYRSI